MIQPDLTKENYHATHSIGGVPLIASSALNYAYPGQGGSMARLNHYLVSQEEVEGEDEKASQALGKLLHKWLENSNLFAVDLEDKPDPWICNVINHAFASVPGRVERMEDLKSHLFPAARAIGAQPRYGEEAIIKNVVEKGTNYFHFLKDNDGKTMITAAQREKLVGMQTSVNNSQWAEIIVGRKHPEADVLNEHPILWNHQGIPCKSLLDMPWINWRKKEARVNDFKTTSAPVKTFVTGQSVVINERGIPIIAQYPGPLYRYRYYRQTSFYEMAIAYWIKKIAPNEDLREWKISQGIFVVGSVAPYEVDYVLVPVQASYIGNLEIAESFSQVIMPLYKTKDYLSW